MILAPESVSTFAGLLADTSRAAMCIALLDGRAWTASELAAYAGIARPTASHHLNQLVDAGLVTELRQGRHRYLRLASAELAELIEHVARVAGRPAAARSLRTVGVARDLALARTCYDHLAGALGVQLFDSMVAAGLLCDANGLTVTAAGRSWFTELAGPEALRSGSRPLARACLDWTERRTHLAGALGASLYQQLVARRWVLPRPGSRAVQVTAEGELALAGLLGVNLAGPPMASLALR
ncbi:MAG: helix-turn-helix domain-containing protein [Streptosporangiaceae bacterium]